MLTRRFLDAALLAATLVAASGAAHAAAERSLMGIVLGRSYRQVLARFGTPSQVQAVVIPVPGQGTAVTPDLNNPAGAPGGPPGYAAPGGSGGPAMGGPPGYGGPAMAGGAGRAARLRGAGRQRWSCDGGPSGLWRARDGGRRQLGRRPGWQRRS
jgi:hypothetical protein